MPVEMVHIDVLPWCGFREPFSSLSHLAGAIVFASLAYALVCRGPDRGIRTISLSVFAGASVLLLICSGLYHFFWPGPVRDLLLRFDVAGVFVLIAASMTPVHAILFSGLSRWLPLGLIWSVATTGIVWRTLFCGLNPGIAGIAFFLLFGWGGTVTAYLLVRRFGWAFIRPALLSGLAYTLGSIILMLHRPTLVPGIIGPHEIWHVLVLIGMSSQWYFVNGFADYQQGSPSSPNQIGGGVLEFAPPSADDE